MEATSDSTTLKSSVDVSVLRCFSCFTFEDWSVGVIHSPVQLPPRCRSSDLLHFLPSHTRPGLSLMHFLRCLTCWHLEWNECQPKKCNCTTIIILNIKSSTYKKYLKKNKPKQNGNKEVMVWCIDDELTVNSPSFICFYVSVLHSVSLSLSVVLARADCETRPLPRIFILEY